MINLYLHNYDKKYNFFYYKMQPNPNQGWGHGSKGY